MTNFTRKDKYAHVQIHKHTSRHSSSIKSLLYSWCKSRKKPVRSILKWQFYLHRSIYTNMRTNDWSKKKTVISIIELIIVFIIIMSCRQHGYPWPSLATFPDRSSPPAGLLCYILCPHIAAVCKFGLVILLLLGHMLGSIVVRHLRARLCFSSSFRRVWLVWPV